MNKEVVLIVEDDDNVAPLEIALASLGNLNIVILADGRDAIDFLRTATAKIAAIITDLHLPRVDGFELVKTIREDKRYAAVPVVVISGDSHPEIPERARLLGANAFFPKPYSPAEVRRAIMGLLHAT